MKYLLDTNIVSKLFDKSAEGHIRIREKIATLNEADEVAVSILTLYELEYGLANAPAERKEVIRKKIEKVKAHFQTLPIAPEGASRFGELKKALKERRSLDKTRIQLHNVDLILATTCLADGRTLVSVDTLYADVVAIEPDLLVENWLTPPQQRIKTGEGQRIKEKETK
ncbi:MAG: type II toxin-antitoxin system VapC family toxin [Deltaproteobacteria bacterium]|nr:type II toxin-antitoxin system VapC family toxin [Deltaproteobacteria bacterium]